ncbi:MAG: thioredoxin [Cyclobacteriaceae bacterium]
MEIKAIDEDNFSDMVLKSAMPVVLDFEAEWCGSCRAMAPIVRELSHEYGDSVTFGKVDVDEAPVLSARFGVRNIPTYLLMKDGMLIERIVGNTPKSVLAKKISDLRGQSNINKS